VNRPLAASIARSAGLAGDQAATDRAGWRFETSWATCEADVREAQQLRYAVFAGELGARLAPPAGTPPGCDADRFDDYCDHLLVRVRAADGELSPRLVGTYRVLGPDGARRAGGYYSESEFDLGPLAPLRPAAVELGRACVDPEWRSGGVILALWSALGSYMTRHRLETMFGCASIGVADGGELARRVWRQLCGSHLASAEWRILPLAPLPLTDDVRDPPGSLRDLPPLVKGYMRAGAKVLGPPALDPEFNTADLPIMMRLADLPARYGKQFLAQR
jgi:putative hemolysin